MVEAPPCISSGMQEEEDAEEVDDVDDDVDDAFTEGGAAALDADDEDDDEGSIRQDWLLGFVEPAEQSTDLLRHRFPSKVGGRPAWLDPKDIPSPQQLTCTSSGAPLDFLLQVYAPVDEPTDQAFHRTVFLFVSPNGDRLSSPGAVRAYRCQLPRSNPYYGHEPAPEAALQPPALQEADAEAVAARDPWRVLEAEAAPEVVSTSVTQITPLPSGVRLYPELELLVEPEEGGEGASASGGDDDGDVDMDAGTRGDGGGRKGVEGSSGGGGRGTDGGAGRTGGTVGGAQVSRLLQEYQDRVAAEGEFADDELQDLNGVNNADQRHFASFQAVVAKAPSQVLRYCFHSGAGPLCPAARPVPPAPADVPPCGRCGAPRQFEFQVMPQLLNYLALDVTDPQALDWNTIAVYSCSASCAASWSGGSAAAAAVNAGCSPTYAEEFVWVQATEADVPSGLL